MSGRDTTYNSRLRTPPTPPAGPNFRTPGRSSSLVSGPDFLGDTKSVRPDRTQTARRLALRGRLQASAQAEHLDFQDLRPLRVAKEVAVDEQTLAAERDMIARQRKLLHQSETLGMIFEHLPQESRPWQGEV